jgi:ribosomal protein S18 acetylase RimI-like enzyme
LGESGRCDTENSAEVERLIGRRVVVRHRVGEKLSDAVGELSVEGAELVVQTRRGPVRVRRSAVTAVRAIPPAVPRRASLSAIARLEELCADAWPALVEERLGAWRLRAADGYTGRANAALAIGSPGMPTGAALDVVRAFADRHGIQPRVQVPIGSPWDRAVTAEGWVLDEGHAAGAVVSVQVADLAVLAGVGPTTQRAKATWTSDSSPDAAWWRLVLGGPPTTGPTAGQRHVLARPPTAGFLLLPDDSSKPVAAGRAVVVEDHVHLSVLTVDAGSRRRGYGTRLLGAAAAWGRERGARWGVLQVAVHNDAALALYAKTGWTEHHRYRYLVPD